jgi:hypothetical protein
LDYAGDSSYVAGLKAPVDTRELVVRKSHLQNARKGGVQDSQPWRSAIAGATMR